MSSAATKRQERSDTVLALDKYDVGGFGATILCFLGAIVSDASQADTQTWLAAAAGSVILTLTVVHARRRASLINNFEAEVEGARNEMARFEAVTKKLEAADLSDSMASAKRQSDDSA